MAQRYNLLWRELKKLGYDLPDIAEYLGRSASHVSRCFNGSSEFQLSEAYRLMDLIDAPHSKLHVYFSKNGMYTPELEVMDMQAEQVKAAMETVGGLARYLQLSTSIKKLVADYGLGGDEYGT